MVGVTPCIDKVMLLSALSKYKCNVIFVLHNYQEKWSTYCNMEHTAQCSYQRKNQIVSIDLHI